MVADLGTVLDETRIVIEPALREAGIALIWEVGDGLPLVQADHHSLLQVFVNLARNSQQALEDCARSRRLRISAAVETRPGAGALPRYRAGRGAARRAVPALSSRGAFRRTRPVHLTRDSAAARRRIAVRAAWSRQLLHSGVMARGECQWKVDLVSNPNNQPIRALLIDDHALFRQSVAQSLATDPNLHVEHCASIRDALHDALAANFRPGAAGP